MKYFILNFTKVFKDSFQKIVTKDKKLTGKIDKTIALLRENPFYPSLKSHKVITRNGRIAISSKVNADLRIIWNYSNDQINVLDVLDIGGHSGKDKIYK